MALRINTNVSALVAHKNLTKTDNMLSTSLERLSSGLRINKAADDASGMAIADALRAQALGLGQGIRNANDGISIVQTADGALEEAINIVNTIKTKAIQAAQDGQTYDSRKKIQADIDRLLGEINILAKTTAFNGKKLLSGEFANRKFQVGATSGETIDVSIGSAETTKLGHVTTAKLTVENTGNIALKIHSNVQNKDFELQAVNMQYNNSPENGIGALADTINKLSDQLGITAQAVVESSTDRAIAAGSISSDFKINGVDMGAVTVVDNDADGALAIAINGKSDQTGVTAAVDSEGRMTLTALDGRGIEVEGDVLTVFGKSAKDLTTFGEIRLTQAGSNGLLVSTIGTGQVIGGDFTSQGAKTTSDIMTLAAGSSIQSGSTLAAGTTLGFTLASADLTADISTTLASTLLAGSVLGSDSVVAKNSVFGGSITIQDVTLTQDATVTTGSTLASDTLLEAGTLITTDIVNSAGVTISAGTTLAVDTRLGDDVILEADMILLKDTDVESGSTIAAGSSLADNTTITGDMTLTTDMALATGSTIEEDSGTSLIAGSTIGGSFSMSDVTTVNQAMTVAAGSTLQSDLVVAKGSTLGFDMEVTDTTISAAMELKAGSMLASDSVLKAGTYLTQDIAVSDGGGVTLQAGTTLEQDATVDSDQFLIADMVIAKDSELLSGTIVANNGGGGLTGANIADTTVHRLFEVDVTSQESAQIAISIADSALTTYDGIRANLGSTQNQLTSTIANLSVTRVNVFAAESAVRDVDFAEESSNFSKMQILSQSGAFAMAQANTSAQIVLSLLQ